MNKFSYGDRITVNAERGETRWSGIVVAQWADYVEVLDMDGRTMLVDIEFCSHNVA